MGVLTVALIREATTAVGRHEHFVVDRDTFIARGRAKAAGAPA